MVLPSSAEEDGESASRPLAAGALDSDSDVSEAEDPVLQHNRDRALLDEDFLETSDQPQSALQPAFLLES